MPKDRRAVESALLRKGFIKEEGDHHYFYYCTTDGKRTSIRTKTSHSMREISDPLLSAMARQVKLTRPELLKLVECTLSRDEYESHLFPENEDD